MLSDIMRKKQQGRNKEPKKGLERTGRKKEGKGGLRGR